MNQDLVLRYLEGQLSPAELFAFESDLASDDTTLGALADAADNQRLASSLVAIASELDTPTPSRTERVVGRIGLSEPTARLVAATPAFRRSFVLAIIAMLLFTSASAESGQGTNRLLTFLALAPILPMVGTALAFGRAADPMHEISISTPIDGFRLVLLRTSAVYVASLLALMPGSILIAEIGPWRWAWLIPGLMLTSTTIALSTRLVPHVAAAWVGGAWLTLISAVSLSTTDDIVLFRAGGQLVFLVVTAVAVAVALSRRHSFEEVGHK